ncbi:MAG TPA: sigma-70 family RNA polymerase sigma factor [Kofleriaceae bacterium]|jgi:RNA polymerase sigma-70 factor (ECF subfamily)
MAEPDLALLDRWCAGDASAGNELFHAHFATLYKFFENKTLGDVDDLVQETLLECVRSRDRFRRQSTFRTYLFAIARHVLFQHWRKKSTARPTLDFDDVSIESLSTSVGTKLTKLSERARLVTVLRTMPLDQQLLLEMFYWQDCDRDQLAEIFDVESATIGSRLHRARQAMKTMLEAPASGIATVPDDLDSWARSLAEKLG